VEDLHVEAGRPLRHGPADAPVPDHAQGGPVHVMGEVGAEAPAVPAALAQIGFGRAGVPGGGQDQEEGEVGRRGIEDPGGVADRNVQFVGGRHVDVVVPHGRIGHDTQPPGLAGPEHGGVDVIGQEAHDAVEVARPGLELVRGQRHIVVGRHDVVPGLQQRIRAAGGQATRDEDPGHAQCVV
jgi:hypothetical protein